MNELDQETLRDYSGKDWCFALHGNHDEHQCHKKPGHDRFHGLETAEELNHECYCGAWW